MALAAVLTTALSGCGGEGGETTDPATAVAPAKAQPTRHSKPQHSPAARAVAAGVAENEREQGPIDAVGCARIRPASGYLAWDCRVDFARGPSMRCRAPDPNRYGVIEVLSCRRAAASRP